MVKDATLPGVSVIPTGSGSVEPVHNKTYAEIVDRIHSEAMALSAQIQDMMFGSDNSGLQRLLFRVDYLRRLLYQTTLTFVKPFSSAEPEDSERNYYMEREWRVYATFYSKCPM